MPLGRNFLAQKRKREPRTQFAAFAAATTACGGRREERGDSNARRRVISGGNLGFRKRNEGKKKLQLVSIFYGADRILLLFSPLLLTGRCSTPKLFTWQKKPRLFYLLPSFLRHRLSFAFRAGREGEKNSHLSRQSPLSIFPPPGGGR